MNRGRRVMIVAGGEWQVPLVQCARRMGCHVISTNLYEDSPAFAYAHEAFVADVLDWQANLRFARQCRPDAVVTDQSDIAVLTVARMCQELGLPGIGLDAAERFTDKHSMRRFCRDHGFRAPPFALCATVDEARRFGAAAGYPVVVKPPASQSSRGVAAVRDAASMAEAFAGAAAFARGAGVLVEGFLPGIELTVEGLKLPGRHYTLAISRKDHMAHNPMVACSLLYTHADAEMDYDRLRDVNDRLVTAMGLPFGLTHAEYKWNGGEFTLVEIAARGGGTKISSHIVPLMSGVATNELLIRMALGETMGAPEPKRVERCAMLTFFQFPSGVLRAVEGLATARALPGVVDLGLTVSPGQTVAPPQDDRARHGHLIVERATVAEVDRLVETVKTLVRPVYV